MLKTLKFIYQHPYNAGNGLGGVWRFAKWQIQSRLQARPVAYPLTAHSRLWIWRGLTGATGNIYCGLLEYYDMAFLLHLLRADDTFVDIGANVGAYTVLASAEIGAKSIAFEPLPTTFGYLKDNIALNSIQSRVTTHNIGLGSTKGSLKFTKSLDTANHVATAADTDTVEVAVNTLDAVLTTTPILMKIDVEGFETEVLKGADNTLRDPALKGIIIELNGSGDKYGYDEDWIHTYLLSLGFRPYHYEPSERSLRELPKYGEHNTIYVRDEAFVRARLQAAAKVQVGRKAI